jgi:hypothetical protein
MSWTRDARYKFGTGDGGLSVVTRGVVAFSYQPWAMYRVPPIRICVPSTRARPAGLNTIADASSLLAAVAPARPPTRASCSLTLKAFAEADALIPTRPSVVNRQLRRFVMWT